MRECSQGPLDHLRTLVPRFPSHLQASFSMTRSRRFSAVSWPREAIVRWAHGGNRLKSGLHHPWVSISRCSGHPFLYRTTTSHSPAGRYFPKLKSLPVNPVYLSTPLSTSTMTAAVGRLPGLGPNFGTTSRALGTVQRSAATDTIAQRLPQGTWDSHMHVVDPDRFLPLSEAAYLPSRYTLKDAINFEDSVGIPNVVLVQPSIYGTDNSCLLEALAALGPERARGVVVCDPKNTTRQQLSEWHAIGVRGIRVNYVSDGPVPAADEIQGTLQLYADIIRPLNWVLQIYLPMALIEVLEGILPRLGVTVCIDHMGCPSLIDHPTDDPYQIPGFSSLISLLRQENIYVKLSAPYRLSKLPSQIDLEPVAKELIRTHGMNRVVFATDWPHTRFEGLDIRPWMEKVLDWCGTDSQLRERLFAKNAEDLWDAQR
ncbi:amidohydrolase domain-containing protein [Sarocladium implicatum]|nr:amidohydrolase domain-containing protein [Sarocladium implicatum]